MLTGDEEKSIRGMLQTTRIIVFALVAGVFSFGFVVLSTKGLPPLILNLNHGPLSLIAIVGAAMSLVMSFVVPKMLGKVMPLNQTPEVSSPKNAPLLLALQQIQTETIIGCAILEGAAFLNLTVAMIEPNLLHLVVAAVVWLFLVARFPLFVDQFIAGVQERLESQDLN